MPPNSPCNPSVHCGGGSLCVGNVCQCPTNYHLVGDTCQLPAAGSVFVLLNCNPLSESGWQVSNGTRAVPRQFHLRQRCLRVSFRNNHLWTGVSSHEECSCWVSVFFFEPLHWSRCLHRRDVPMSDRDVCGERRLSVTRWRPARIQLRQSRTLRWRSNLCR